MSIPGDGNIFLSDTEIANLPTSGVAWDELMVTANADFGTVDKHLPASLDINDLTEQDMFGDSHTWAAGLAYKKTGNPDYLDLVVKGINEIIGTETGTRTLSIARNVTGYVLAADIADIKNTAPKTHLRFVGWIRYLLQELIYENCDANDNCQQVRSIEDIANIRPNNWGKSADATITAIYQYLENLDGIEHQKYNLQTWCGYLPRTSYRFNDRYDYSKLGQGTWQSDPDNPLGINPTGATITYDGIARDVDGVCTEEARRAGDFSWPPPVTNYYWSNFVPLFIQLRLFQNVGIDPLPWANNAFHRCIEWPWNHYWTASYTDDSPVAAGTPGANHYFSGDTHYFGLQDEVDIMYLADYVLSENYPIRYADPALHSKPAGYSFFGKPPKTVSMFFYTHGTQPYFNSLSFRTANIVGENPLFD